LRSLYRAMKPHGDRPLVEQSARGLGVRTEGLVRDVNPDAEGRVHPGEGMSVAPDDPLFLDPHRRPAEFGGTGKDPVWEISDEALPGSLVVRLDAPDHGLIEPRAPIELAAYREALAETSPEWRLVR
jgi:hypothetical protein